MARNNNIIKISSKSIENHWFSSENGTRTTCEPLFDTSKWCDDIEICFNETLPTWSVCFFLPKIKILICPRAYSKTNCQAAPKIPSKYHQNPLKPIDFHHFPDSFWEISDQKRGESQNDNFTMFGVLKTLYLVPRTYFWCQNIISDSFRTYFLEKHGYPMRRWTP